MENRSDLADILFAGLPEGEAEHVRTIIQQSDEHLIARKRAVIDVVNLSDAETADGSDEESLVS